jgi:hypothetical protein
LTNNQEYIKEVNRQIIELLDEKDVLLQKAAVHIISYMFPRHSIFLEHYILKPIRSSLLPSKDEILRAVDIISNDASITTALRRIESLVSTPYPALLSSLLRPLLLNLYILAAYIHKSPRASLKQQVLHILRTYVTAAPSAAQDVFYFIDRMLYSATSEGWTWTAGDEGGIAIRRTTADDVNEDMGMDEVQARVELIVEILGGASDDVLSEVFVGIMRRWLSSGDNNPIQYRIPSTLLIEGLLQMCSYCKNSYRHIRLNC